MFNPTLRKGFNRCMFIYNFMKICILYRKLKIARLHYLRAFNDATPVDPGKVAVKTVGIEMRKIAFFNLLPFA